MFFNLPIAVTVTRILLVPIIVVALLTQYWLLAACLFFIAAITDCLDGWLARVYNQQTYFGALLDPIADKFLLLACFFTIAYMQSPLVGVPYWFVWIMAIKEIMLMLGSFCIWSVQGYVIIKPTLLGKITTLVHILFIMWLFLCHFFSWHPFKTYWIILILLAGMTMSTLVHYCYLGWQKLYQRKV